MSRYEIRWMNAGIADRKAGLSPMTPPKRAFKARRAYLAGYTNGASELENVPR